MAAPVDHGTSVEGVLAMHARLEPAEGFKAEVIDGIVALSPTPSGRHGLIQAKLQVQLIRLVPDGLAVTNTITLDVAATRERYVPDLLVIPEDALRTDEWLLDVCAAELVVEIVSPHNARHDRVVKVRGYAAAGVPVYLLVDPLEETVTLFWEPADGSYQQMHRVPFGGTLALPEPFGGKIETAAFS